MASLSSESAKQAEESPEEPPGPNFHHHLHPDRDSGGSSDPDPDEEASSAASESPSERLLRSFQRAARSFSPDQVSCLCEALLQAGDAERLQRFLRTVAPPAAELLRGNETLLKARALVAFHREDFQVRPPPLV